MRMFKLQRLVLVLGWMFVVACPGDSAKYSPEKDDVAMQDILSHWSDGDLEIYLCEDVQTAEGQVNGDCQVEHVARAGGLGEAHSENHSGVGCGGCPFMLVAYVEGTLSGGPFSEGPVTLRGEVNMSGGYADDPYDLPYSFYLSCDEDMGDCWVDGTIERGGTLRLSVSKSGQASDHVLDLTGSSSCPGDNN